MGRRFATPMIAPVIPITTTEMMSPTHSIVRNFEGVYGRVAACIRPMQMVLMDKPRIAPPTSHKTIPFPSLYPMKANARAVRIDNRYADKLE